MARPTKLTPELMEQARAHVESFDISTHTLLPTIEGLAIELHISRETVYAWEQENDEFSDIVKELRARQANKLIQNGLANRYNAMIAKLILSGKHGYVEKTETDTKIDATVEHSLKGKSDEELDEIIDSYKGTRS